MPDHRPVLITEGFSRDLDWCRNFIQVFNGSTSFVNWQGESDFHVYIDVSLLRLGAVCHDQFYSVSLPSFVKCEKQIDCHL